MFYRIRLDLAFNGENPPRDVLDKVEDHLKDAIVINPGMINEERGFILLEKCYHDEDPSKPCEVLEKRFLPAPGIEGVPG